MTEFNARLEFPTWANSTIHDTKATARHAASGTEARKQMKSAIKYSTVRFLKKHAIAILTVIAVFMYGWIVAAITERTTRIRVTEEVTREVTAELRSNMQVYMNNLEAERQAEAFLSGEASLQAQIEEEARPLARFIYGYMTHGTTKRNTLTAAWGVIVRTDSPAYPGSILEVVEQPQQWMFYNPESPLREEDLQLAREILTKWHAGEYPDGLTQDFVYAEWTQSDVVLRNTWEKNSKTVYWRISE